MQAKGQIKPKSRLASRRFSQKTNGRICFVCFLTLHGKQIKFVRSFLRRIYVAPICFSVYLTFKLHEPNNFGMFWKCAQVKPVPLKSAEAKDLVYRVLPCKQKPVTKICTIGQHTTSFIFIIMANGLIRSLVCIPVFCSKKSQSAFWHVLILILLFNRTSL